MPRMQPGLAAGQLLALCETADQAARMLTDTFALAGVPLLGTVPPLHWIFADRTGEAVVIEPDADGLHVYRSTAGGADQQPALSLAADQPASTTPGCRPPTGAVSGPGTRWWSPAFPAAAARACRGISVPRPGLCGWPFCASTPCPPAPRPATWPRAFTCCRTWPFRWGRCSRRAPPPPPRLDSAVAPLRLHGVQHGALRREPPPLLDHLADAGPPVCRDGPRCWPGGPSAGCRWTGMESFSATTGCRMCGPNENRPRKGYPSGGGWRLWFGLQLHADQLGAALGAQAVAPGAGAAADNRRGPGPPVCGRSSVH